MRITICLILFFFFSPELVSQSDSTIFDPLMLKEIVVTDFKSGKKLNSPLSLTSIERPSDSQIQGVASTLLQVPGIFSDASAGEVFSRVYSRGISLSAEDDIGWYYMSLQEDGLPVTAVQYNQYSPDFFFRPDVSYDRVEVVRGGKSSILAPSGPGGVINFISENISGPYSTHDRITTGIYAGGRPYIRVEGISGSRIGNSPWSYDFSYLYRYDKGPRNIDYSFNDGGQIKLGLKKTLKNGILSFRIKWLNDKVNRYTGVAAVNWNDPVPAFNQSFQNTSLLPPGINGMLPDPRTYNSPGPANSLVYDPSNGIKARELSSLITLDLQLGEWRLKNKLKYSAKSLNWQTAIGGQPLSLENFITYFISGDPFPIGNVNFTDISSGQLLATIDNQGAFAVFQGMSPSFQYVSGSLPGDAILGSGSWVKDDQINEWMNQLLLQRSFEDLSLNLGAFYSKSNVDIFTNASFIYATYENEPRILEVSLDGPDGQRRSLSDENGLSNYGGLFYESADIISDQLGLFGDAELFLTDWLSFNLGLRFEHIAHNGFKERSSPLSADGGLDSNPLTSFDNGLLVNSGTDQIDASYNYLSYSFSFDFDLNNHTSAFTRYSLGHKSPELNYYINNFSNQEIPALEPPVQDIRQFEVGIKQLLKNSSITATAYISRLSNVGYSNFVFDDQVNQIFYTPTQFNSTRTIGIELEWGVSLSNNLTFKSSATIQNPKLTSFTLYDANGSIDTGDDQIVDFSQNRIPHNPGFMASAGLEYDQQDWFSMIRINHVGRRYGNLENAFKLPSYSTMDLDLGYALSKKFAVGLRCRNLFNSAGLANFFGPNTFGSNSDAASSDFIASHPNESFVVFPIMPRAIYLSLDYTFSN